MATNRVTELMAESSVSSESVLLSTCKTFGIEVDEKVIPKVAYALASGIGSTGAVCCGAVAMKDAVTRTVDRSAIRRAIRRN